MHEEDGACSYAAQGSIDGINHEGEDMSCSDYGSCW